MQRGRSSPLTSCRDLDYRRSSRGVASERLRHRGEKNGNLLNIATNLATNTMADHGEKITSVESMVVNVRHKSRAPPTEKGVRGSRFTLLNAEVDQQRDMEEATGSDNHDPMIGYSQTEGDGEVAKDRLDSTSTEIEMDEDEVESKAT